MNYIGPLNKNTGRKQVFDKHNITSNEGNAFLFCLYHIVSYECVAISTKRWFKVTSLENSMHLESCVKSSVRSQTQNNSRVFIILRTFLFAVEFEKKSGVYGEGSKSSLEAFKVDNK